MPRTYNATEVKRGYRKLQDLSRQDPGQGLELRKSKEKFGWYLVDGVRIFYVSSKAPQSGDVGPGRLQVLKRYLKLTDEEFADLCDCRMTGPTYHRLVRESPRFLAGP